MTPARCARHPVCCVVFGWLLVVEATPALSQTAPNALRGPSPPPATPSATANRLRTFTIPRTPVAPLTPTPTASSPQPNTDAPPSTSGTATATDGLPSATLIPTTPAAPKWSSPGGGRVVPAQATDESSARFRLGGEPTPVGGSQIQIRPTAKPLPTSPTPTNASQPNTNDRYGRPAIAMPGTTGGSTIQVKPAAPTATGSTPTWPVAPPQKPLPSTIEIAPSAKVVPPPGAEPTVRVVPKPAATATAPSSPTESPIATPTPATDAPKTALLPPVPTGDVAPDGTLPAATLPAAPPTTAKSSTVPVEIVPVDFNGVTLGETTVNEMIAAWGKPVEQMTEPGSLRYRFVIEPFAGVVVMCLDDKAASIIVDLGEAFTTDAVARELHLGDVAPVDVRDEAGRLLGLIYPERGVSLRFDGDAAERRVTFIGLDRIDARPFVLRAEQRMETDYTAAAADLQTALKLDADNGRALWLKARILQAVGRRREALEAVETALKQEPKGAEYLLTRAALLAEAGLFTAAVADVAAVIDGTAAVPHLQAQAWCLRGDLFAAGPERDYGQALDAHTRAVRLAEPAVADNRLAARRAAKQTLIEAHLGVAEDIAWGDWQKKETIVPQWLDKAERLAEEWSKQGELPADVQLTIGRRAAGCFVGLQGAGDPAAWSERLQTFAAGPIADPQADPTLRRHRQWECGLGLYDCLQAFHARGDVAEALRCGESAVELLAAGREGRDPLPTDAYMFGRLYFRIGSIYALKRQDHAKAVEWFDRAAPLLERPLPEAVAADRGRQGETLVSMGVSYWAVGKRERAMELTGAGGRYMQAAVESGSLKPDALAVPYANLAAMHRQLGDDAAGKKFAEMATRAEAGGGALRR